MWKRALGLLLLLCVFFYPLQPQELLFKHIDWEELETNIDCLSNELKYQQNLVNSLENRQQIQTENYKKLEEAYNIQTALLEASENKYKELENTVIIWKAGTIGFGITTIICGVILWKIVK